MATNNRWNGTLLGAAFAVLGLWAIKGAQATVPDSNFANIVYGWFTSGAHYLITNVSWMSTFSETWLAFGIAALLGIILGLWVEYK